MPQMPSMFRPVRNIDKHGPREARFKSDERRGSARKRGYTTAWEKARKQFLAELPLCSCCHAHGRLEPARIVDHIIPHKGDDRLFWDKGNWQGLCEWCDKNIKRSVENRWLRNGGDAAVLRLDYVVSGWVHPTAR